MSSLEELIAAWDGEAVVCRFDRPTASWIFIALHDLRPGPAAGGTRMKTYDHPTDALVDAQRLAEGMTHKWRGIGIERGGGKAVLSVPTDLETDARDGLLTRYARLVESLAGAFRTGCDLGVSPADMLHMSRDTRWVHGILAGGRSLDPGPYTARGVRLGIEAAVERIFGNASLAGRSVLVEGLGAVGEPLARELSGLGAHLILSDLDAGRARRLGAELGAETTPSRKVLTTACDVYAPCAVGGTLTAETVPRLACRIVAGSANNQLGRPEDAELLHENGILYAPDYIVNSGGALIFGSMDPDSPEAPAMEPLVVIGSRLREIFRHAAETDESPSATARRLIESH
jgi:leucine dehydrogenase